MLHYHVYMPDMPKRKRIRLDRTLYQMPGSIVAVTVGVDRRIRAFVDGKMASECIELLRERSEGKSVSILAYCFMPDHLHLLIRVDAAGDVVDFMRDYKSRSTRIAWKRGYQGRFWQRGYYDHILREHEDPVKQIRYILENPVRAEIVDQWSEYPFIGSFTFDIHLPENWEPADR